MRSIVLSAWRRAAACSVGWSTVVVSHRSGDDLSDDDMRTSPWNSGTRSANMPIREFCAASNMALNARSSSPFWSPSASNDQSKPVRPMASSVALPTK